jgi:hypothetical protein
VFAVCAARAVLTHSLLAMLCQATVYEA